MGFRILGQQQRKVVARQLQVIKEMMMVDVAFTVLVEWVETAAMVAVTLAKAEAPAAAVRFLSTLNHYEDICNIIFY